MCLELNYTDSFVFFVCFFIERYIYIAHPNFWLHIFTRLLPMTIKKKWSFINEGVNVYLVAILQAAPYLTTSVYADLPWRNC